MECGLCGAAQHELFYCQRRGLLSGREFWRCRSCQLIQVAPAQRLSPSEEKAIYDLHENDPDDPGYRRFLARCLTPLQPRLQPGAKGLDFGCGPGPALASMLNSAGFPCTTYDIYYAPYPERLRKTYDFITCTEVIEHLAEPAVILAQLSACLRPGGLLALMTKRWHNLEQFKGWSYRNDPTHISFFHADSFRWLAAHWQLEIEYDQQDVVLLRKPA
ncbi:class I SAM-dependent methyltransferase [Pseudidiomarina terrestris]|uniref:class I SAM-dependent methyltransferase n=1 Tax=Pseudidiomarina terrestris TaxID=2820060 RepID=UPI002659F013|nr:MULTISPECIES: class I SAM-dependent methyltransferase [unclassified Pseudidiomarina]